MYPGVARPVKLGSKLIGASPYSVNRAWPLLSITTFACQHKISTITQVRSREKETDAPNGRARNRGENLPPLYHHGEYPNCEGIPVPSPHRTATYHVESGNAFGRDENQSFTHQKRPRDVGV